MTKWVREARPATCDWWQTTEYPDDPVWHTECEGCGRNDRDQALANEMMRNFGADYCPWCGGECSEVSYDEVIADAQADLDYKDGIAHGKMGY